MQITKLPVDNTKRATIQCGSKEFPLGVFVSDLHKFDLGHVRWHWHNEVEFILVRKGTIKVSIDNTSIVLQENNGMFINAEVIHMFTPIDGAKAIVHSCVVHPEIFYHRSDSLLREQYIEPVLNCSDMPYIVFDSSIPWCAESCTHIRKTIELNESGKFGFEFAMYSRMCELWYLLVSNTSAKIKQNVSELHISNKRIKKMMSYIHEYYNSPLTLENIAQSAGVSKSECHRLFKKHLSMKPFEYLTKYRVNMSVHLLKETNLPIADISTACGFRSSSYFAKMFNQIISLSPNNYRKKEISAFKKLKKC